MDKIDNDFFGKSIEIEVRYAEVDKMGVVHHSRYWVWFEILRIKWLESHYLSYVEIEEKGLALPLITGEIKYILPVKFGEKLIIKGNPSRQSLNVIRFDYSINNQQKILTTTANTTHTMVNSHFRVTPLPKKIRAILPLKNNKTTS